MNKTLSTILIVIAILALAGGIFFFGTMYARASVFGPGMMAFAPGTSTGVPVYGTNNNNSYGPGTAGGYGIGPGMMGTGRGGYGMGPGHDEWLRLE